MRALDEEFVTTFSQVLRLLRAYHRHEVQGLEHVPTEGGVLIASNHSLATYDMSLLMLAIYEAQHRMTRSLIDRAFFRIPGLGEFMERIGSVMGTPENAHALLEEGEILMVAPGGMREALRPSSERYQIMWEKRRGFAKLAMETGVPVILAACPKADEIYDVKPSSLTKWVYQRIRMPLPVAFGWGHTFLPKPVKLRHFLSEPQYPPRMTGDEEKDEAALARFHRQLIKRMRSLLWEGVNYRG